MSFGRLTHVDPRNHVLDGSQDRMNLFAAMTGDTTVMRPFAKLRYTLVYFYIDRYQQAANICLLYNTAIVLYMVNPIYKTEWQIDSRLL